MSGGDDFLGMMSAVFGKPVVLFDGKNGEVDGLLFVLDKPPEDRPVEDRSAEDDKKEE